MFNGTKIKLRHKPLSIRRICILINIDTEAPVLNLDLSIINGIVTSKIYDKQDDLNFEIVNFPFLD